MILVCCRLLRIMYEVNLNIRRVCVERINYVEECLAEWKDPQSAVAKEI